MIKIKETNPAPPSCAVAPLYTGVCLQVEEKEKEKENGVSGVGNTVGPDRREQRKRVGVTGQ